jgi:hypothetical protein
VQFVAHVRHEFFGPSGREQSWRRGWFKQMRKAGADLEQCKVDLNKCQSTLEKIANSVDSLVKKLERLGENIERIHVQIGDSLSAEHLFSVDDDYIRDIASLYWRIAMEVDAELVEKLDIEEYRIRPGGPENEYNDEDEEDYGENEEYIEREQLSVIFNNFLEDCFGLLSGLKRLNFPA